MKKLFLVAAGLLMPLMAFAQNYYGQRFGNQYYWHGSNGYNGYGQQLGNQYYYHDNYGNGFGQRFGNQYYYHYTPHWNNGY
jgi:hypothetical protein